MNTAQLKAKGYDLAASREYGAAAVCYLQALESYPPHHPGDQLALADKAKIADLMKLYVRGHRAATNLEKEGLL